MWLDVLALLLLGLFAGMGALRGGLASGLSLATLLVAYGAAIVLGGALGPAAAAWVGVPGWAGLALAGTAAFLAAFLLMSILSRLLRRLEDRGEGEGRSARDRFLGGVFGAVRGGILVLLLSYLALWVDALRLSGAAAPLPELGSSAAASLTGSVVEAGMSAALDEAGPAGRAAAHLAARPGRALVDLQEVMEHPAVGALRGDAIFWSHVEHGNVDAALHRRAALALLYDADLRRRLGDLRLLEPEAVRDPMAFRAVTADVLREVGPRIRGLRNDPALRELLEDPELAEAVRGGDHLTLLGHPGFRAVVARVMERPVAE
jgi:membrane protein required for colicin V production